ncbi:MAG TPA: SCO family protein [Niabella sp.]|nr:SCO family protein [Niabella sp.]HOZ97222.1 SCO family protein [Niabella sp.]HQW14200.1 SCO family protein [Niabella sp.]HQX19600.1 SCO family protein [Niabella sp.]HQX39966.1 SCO family protein [Niabella sp.]
MKQSLFLLLLSLILFSCKQEKTNKELPSDSIFHLTSEWQNQKGDSLKLNDLRGKTLVVVMIYTSCKAACPLLVADMKKIEKKIKPNNLDKISLVLVSIDPETDTPQRLAEFAKTGGMSAPHWVFLRSNEASTQEFANVLSMKYKKISPIDFSHSNIISIFNTTGELIMQEEGTNIDVGKVAGKVNELVKNS